VFWYTSTEAAAMTLLERILPILLLLKFLGKQQSSYFADQDEPHDTHENCGGCGGFPAAKVLQG